MGRRTKRSFEFRVSGFELEVRDQRSEVRVQKAEGGRQKAGGRTRGHGDGDTREEGSKHDCSLHSASTARVCLS